MALVSQFPTRFNLNGMFNAFECGPFFQFISQGIRQATSSLVSRLETRKTLLESLEARLETRSSKRLRIESRGARIETRGTVYLPLSGTGDVGKYPPNNAFRIWIDCFKLGGIFTIELPTGMNISFHF